MEGRDESAPASADGPAVHGSVTAAGGSAAVDASPAALIGGATVAWVERVVGARVVSARGLLPSGSPWLLTLDRGAPVVLRSEITDQAAERAALGLAAAHDVAAPRLLAQHPELGSVITVVTGSSRIPAGPRPDRARALGALAARLHAVPVDLAAPGHGLVERTRPIETVDFAAWRRGGDTTPLLDAADAALARLPRPTGSAFVHGDLWQGNVMWADATGAEITAVIDWDAAGHGHPGVDVGSLRLDVAVISGVEHAAAVDDGWASVAGHAPRDQAYFDVVAALSSPTDMGYFTDTINGQLDGTLDRAVAVERRDEFLRRALAALGMASADDGAPG